MDTVEKLEELLAIREAEIKRHESNIASSKDEIARLKGEVNGLALAIRLCTENDTPIRSPNGTPALIGKYSGLTLTPAVLDIIHQHGNPPGLLGSEIVDRLKSEGFKSEAKEFYSSVYSIALRLIKRGKVREGHKEGKRTFMRQAT